MKKRNIFMLIAGGVLCFALSACGTENTNGGNDTPEQTTGSAEATVAAQIPETVEQPASTEQTVEATQEEYTVDATLETGDDERGTYPDGSSPEYSGVKCCLTVDGDEIVIAMYDNTAADAFLERLPLENQNFYDLSGIEKPAETPDVPFSIGNEEPGYDPASGEMVIYRPWGNYTIFYGDYRHSDELVPLGKVESGLEILAGKAEDFTGTIELME